MSKHKQPAQPVKIPPAAQSVGGGVKPIAVAVRAACYGIGLEWRARQKAS